MLDIKFIRENPEIVKKAVANKKANVDINALLALDERKRHVSHELESKRAEQNASSRGGPKSSEELDKLRKLKESIKILEEEFVRVETELESVMFTVPNIPSDDTPIGSDENGNKVLRQWGKLPSFSAQGVFASGGDFVPKEHWELGQELGILDIERAAKVSGTRFGYLKGGLAILEFALIQYGLSIMTDEGNLKKIIKKAKLDVKPKPFTPVVPPVLIKPEVMLKMARLEPKEERYYIPSDDMYLVGSAEHTLGPMHMDEVLKEEDLPVRYIGFSTAFRREAGSYGKDTKGILRVHQFDKLEMESFCLSEDSIKEQDFFVAIQENIMQGLQLPYRVVAICTGDMGGPDARQIDIETWMPGQNKYRETHTADLMTDYQARRLNTRVRRRDNKNEFVHMNDATAIAIGRVLIAIVENYQTKNGTIKVPKILQKFALGLKEIKLR
jgi:seryl-tRNA synthetase